MEPKHSGRSHVARSACASHRTASAEASRPILERGAFQNPSVPPAIAACDQEKSTAASTIFSAFVVAALVSSEPMPSTWMWTKKPCVPVENCHGVPLAVAWHDPTF